MELRDYNELTYNNIGAAMAVYNELGNGFKESVYQEALALELEEQGIPFEREKRFQVHYKGTLLSTDFVADFLCYDCIIVELKALSQLGNEHRSQVLNYLKASNTEVGLLINFGESSLKYERLIFNQANNKYKGFRPNKTIRSIR